ncbi:MAG: PLP-dependent aminotransferase family protein [Actinobacteria bacterium]|nr:PLP-dependent aminotransferase family protein [Actinomycetota bacterium]MBI3686952.1 PLP-dependent aminotransferase family protein [Actinomycetota bacterium]
MSMDWATFGLDLHVELDSTSGRRSALESALRESIRDGRLAAQTRLPSTRALAAELDLARGTVSAAYDQLIAEGYLTARTGSGTYVTGLVRAVARPARAVDTSGPAAGPRYDLRPGSPDVTSFPTAAWLRATRRALAEAPMAAYDYGDPRGRIELRTALASYLGRVRGVAATPDRIVVTSGAVQALSLLAGVIGRTAGARIAMEDPGLAFHREVVRRNHVDVMALEVDDRGARTDLLLTSDFTAVRAVVVTASHQYPTGVPLHPQRRDTAAEWARSREGLIIEDDYDGEFRYDRQPIGALQGTAPEQVAYLGTVSKTLGPALRLGWLVLPERLIEPVVEAKRYTDLHTESIGQLALADLITSHAYDRHVRSCRLRYRSRRDLLTGRLEPHAGQRLTLRGIPAGLHAWIDLPAAGPSEHDVLVAGTARGLALGYLSSHWHDPDGRPQGIIVGFGTPSESTYPIALDTLNHVLRRLTLRR